MSDKDNKTEEATAKKLRDTREKGQVSKSQDLNAGIALLVYGVILGSLGKYVFLKGFKYLKVYLQSSIYNDLEITNLRAVFLNSIFTYFSLVIPIALIGIVVGVLSNLAQVGFLFTTKSLKPDFNRLNPISGFKNIFSKKAAMNFLKNFSKLIIVIILFYKNILSTSKEILNSGNIGTEKLFFFFIAFLKKNTFNIIVVMFILGVVDFFVEKRNYKKELRMSKDEIKEEMKEMEGSPEMKSARRQRQMEISMGTMMSNVKESTVVVTNPTHLAIAIKYEKGKDLAPMIMAKGADYIAQKIREEAKEHNIPIVENKPLARSMYKRVEVGDYVPSELYKAVAELLVIVYELEEANKGKI